MRKLALFFLFLINYLTSKEINAPWLTGSLIAPVGEVIPYGRVLVKPSLKFCASHDIYNIDWQEVPLNHYYYSLNLQPQLFAGLTPWCDIHIVPQFIYNTSSSEHFVYPGDLILGLDIQLLNVDATPYFPGIKFAIREIFPTGKYERLSVRKLLTDVTGKGTYATELDLILYKLLHLSQLHWLSINLSAAYRINTPIEVHGFNTYGGGFGTKGKVLPGNLFQGICGFEFTLNQRLGIALDTMYVHTERNEFYGTPGISLNGTVATVGNPSSDQLSLAPAIEYNWSSNLGMIAGYWFSIWERNQSKFQSGVLNVKYTY